MIALGSSGVLLVPPATAAAPGENVLVSHAAANATHSSNNLNDDSQARAPSISGGGRYVVYSSLATNLVNGVSDGNDDFDVFVWDRDTNTTMLVSHAADDPAATANGASTDPVISNDGTHVAFQSSASNLVPGQVNVCSCSNLFLYETGTGAISLVTHQAGNPTTAANGSSLRPSISEDGLNLAYSSDATNLVNGQSGGGQNVFWYDRGFDVSLLVSHAVGDTRAPANDTSAAARISADGESVAFQSSATNLVIGEDTNDRTDVFLWYQGGRTILVSHRFDSATTPSSGAAFPSISGDGKRVVFLSSGSTLVSGFADGNGGNDPDVYLFTFDEADGFTGPVRLVSHVPGSTTASGNGPAGNAEISIDGGSVAFSSKATNHVAGQSDSSGSDDVFVFDVATGVIALVSHAADSQTTTGNGPTDGTAGTMSSDGAFVAFTSLATNHVAGVTDDNASADVFLYERASGTLSLASHAADSTSHVADNVSFSATISVDGSAVSFYSAARDLVPDFVDNNDFHWDVYMHTRVAPDSTPPGVTIDQAASQPDPTDEGNIFFTVSFTEPVTHFTVDDVSLAGSTATGAAPAVVSGGPVTYELLVTGMTTPGTVVASIPAGAAGDLAGNASLASTSTDNTVTWTTTSTTTTSTSTTLPTTSTTLPTTTSTSTTSTSTTLPTTTSTSTSSTSTTTSSTSLPPGVDCAGVTPTIVGTDGSDNITGTRNTDVILGLGGNDTINGKGGDDIICGDDGDDTIAGDSGKDTIHGGSGNDTLTGGVDDDAAEGGTGDDTVTGNDGNDQAFGGDGADTVTGGNGEDLVSGGDDDDVVAGSKGDDHVLGNGGDDRVLGDQGNDILEGNEDSDVLNAIRGDGGAFSDTLSGGPETDQCFSDPGDTPPDLAGANC